jgi:hypothetical protein
MGVARLKRFGSIAVVVIVLLTGSVIVLMNKFSTLNPVMSGMGLAKIMFTNGEIVQIQKYPQVYLAKPDNAQQSLIDFMEQHGYQILGR